MDSEIGARGKGVGNYVAVTAAVAAHYHQYATNPDYRDFIDTTGETINEKVTALAAFIAAMVGSEPYGAQNIGQLEAGIKSHEDIIREHQQKLKDYTANPDLVDNKGILAGAWTPEERTRIIEVRINTINKQIENIGKRLTKRKRK